MLESPKTESWGCPGVSSIVIQLNRPLPFLLIFLLSLFLSYVLLLFHAPKCRAFWYWLCNPVHTSLSLGANNCTVCKISPTACQKKVKCLLFTVLYAVFLLDFFLWTLTSAGNLFSPFQQQWKLRVMFNLCGITESKSLTLSTLQCQARFSPKSLLGKKRELLSILSLLLEDVLILILFLITPFFSGKTHYPETLIINARFWCL